MSFTIVIEPDEDGASIVTVPAPPEVATCGNTRDEAMANAREAIEHRRSRGEPIAADRVAVIELVTIAA